MEGIGIPFYSPAEWAAAKAAMPDGHTFHATYEQFVATVEASQRKLAAGGIATIRVHVVVDEFFAWCRARGCQVNAQARATYAAERARDLHQQGRRG